MLAVSLDAPCPQSPLADGAAVWQIRAHDLTPVMKILSPRNIRCSYFLDGLLKADSVL